ncbi:MAG TPA: hypothetical protein VGB07_21010, partial [Blastocatellia bacterium]
SGFSGSSLLVRRSFPRLSLQAACAATGHTHALTTTSTDGGGQATCLGLRNVVAHCLHLQYLILWEKCDDYSVRVCRPMTGRLRSPTSRRPSGNFNLFLMSHLFSALTLHFTKVLVILYDFDSFIAAARTDNKTA